MTWKTKVSKANVLLFQLQASVHGIKEKGSGLLPTPVVSDHLHNQSESIENWTKRSKEKKKQGINLHFALRHHVQMYPTPTTMDHIDRKGMRPSRAATNRKTGYLSEMIKMYPTPRAADVEGGAVKNVQLENGHFFRENKKGVRWGVKLRDAVEMYPTPTRGMYKQDVKDNGEYARSIKEKGHQIMLPAFMKLYPTPVARDHKDAGYNTTWKESRDQKSSLPRQVLKDNKPGGRLNPNFVEFLMGYPMNWTKIDPTE
jgi:hypothetical protein